MSGKPVPEAAISFLSEHSHFKSSAVLQAVQACFEQACAEKDPTMRFFQVPLREKLLSFETSLLWLTFMHTQGAQFAEPLDVRAALSAITAMYDLAVENKVLCHTFEEEEEDDDDEED